MRHQVINGRRNYAMKQKKSGIFAHWTWGTTAFLFIVAFLIYVALK